MLDFLGDLRRTHTCGALRASDAGSRVTLMGWVNRRRDHGQLLFVDLRDRTGITQVVFDASSNPALYEKASRVRGEFVLAVIGRVVKRSANTVNPNMPTGEIEVAAEELRVLNEAKTPPFSPAEDAESAVANEETRLKYRYLDLRRPAMQANIELRHKVALAIRNELAAMGFFEIETPFMTRSTPEGARDYLVPSRVHPGSFYALPQSPQLFKQILMISGFDKYFQIVRCFRDEDLRADRQPEFTQIDLEMTYPQQERVFEVVERFLTAAFKAAGVELKTPFSRMTYDEAMRQYGSDKPDLRLPPMVDVAVNFDGELGKLLGINAKLPVLAIRTPNVGELTRKQLEEHNNSPALGILHPMRKVQRLDLRRMEKSHPVVVAAIRSAVNAETADLVEVLAGKDFLNEDPRQGNQHIVRQTAGAFRIWLGDWYKQQHKLFETNRKSNDAYRWLWVTDFPMFEWDADGQRWAAAHHPFTSPHERDMQKVIEGRELGSVRALAYDVVLNGTELGSGSIRIHRHDVQRQIFKALGMTEEEARSRFGFFLEALEYGTPPHGGIALGLDRIVMLLAGASSLREVIPFPKTAKAVDLMVDAPTPVSEQQLRELGIGVKRVEKQS